jgi:hypothetical protein
VNPDGLEKSHLSNRLEKIHHACLSLKIKTGGKREPKIVTRIIQPERIAIQQEGGA